MGPLRFELKLPTPQAGRIPNYPTVPSREGQYLVYEVSVGEYHPSAAVSFNVQIVKYIRDFLWGNFPARGFDLIHSFHIFHVIRSNNFPATETSNRYNHQITCKISVSLPGLRFPWVSSAFFFLCHLQA